MRPGSVHRHALPQISRGIQPSLPADYLILFAKACFGCRQSAYCQATELTFITGDKGKSRVVTRSLCAALAALPALQRRTARLPSTSLPVSLRHTLFSIQSPSGGARLRSFCIRRCQTPPLSFFFLPELFLASRRLKLSLI